MWVKQMNRLLHSQQEISPNAELCVGEKTMGDFEASFIIFVYIFQILKISLY